MALTKSILTTLLPRSVANSLLCLACSTVLGACSSVAGSDLISFWQVATGAFETKPRITPAIAASQPYASIGVRLGNSAELMLLLAEESGQTLTWTSSSHVILVTQNGHIVTTGGLPFNLTKHTIPASEQSDDTKGQYHSEMDFSDLGLRGVVITCDPTPAVSDQIIILEHTFGVQHTTEDCVSASRQLRWSFRNEYWTDPSSGLILKSIQYVHPRLPPLEIEVLRRRG